MRIIATLIIALAVFSFAPSTKCQRATEVQIRTSGSVPEVAGLYDCMRNLEKEVYSKEKAETCIQQADATKCFTRAQFKTRPLKNGRVEVTFILESLSLAVRALRVQVPAEDEAPLLSWLQRNPLTIREGGPYTRQAEVSTATGIERYYAAKGLQVGVSSTVDLDYLSKSARLTFSVTTGPKQPRAPELPPYSNLCASSVNALDWSDFNEYVPIPLVRETVALRAVGVCFSENTFDSDKHALEQLGIFTKVSGTFTGPPAFRQISLSLAAAPLEASEVIVEKYGVPVQAVAGQTPELPLKSGSTYTQQLAKESMKQLEAFFGSGAVRTEISERDALVGNRSIKVTFRVLCYPADQLVINGRTISARSLDSTAERLTSSARSPESTWKR